MPQFLEFYDDGMVLAFKKLRHEFIYTNTSSFVGVRAVADPHCTCHVEEPIVCLNGGMPLAERCECLPSLEDGHSHRSAGGVLPLEGPEGRCELLGIGFHGNKLGYNATAWSSL